MKPQNYTNVLALFEMLFDEITPVIRVANETCSNTSQDGYYSEAGKASQYAFDLTNYCKKLELLRTEWKGMHQNNNTSRKHTEKSRTRKPARLKNGMRTPETDYYIPILKALVLKGGRAPLNEVLNTVFSDMKSRLKDVDYEGMPSMPKIPRWQNTAQWARTAMKKEGLMVDSPHGTWEISDKGREYLSMGETKLIKELMMLAH